MPFPSRINTYLPVAAEGDFASANPIISVLNPVEGSLITGPEGVTVARFAWIDANGIATNHGTGTPSGYVHHRQNALITQFMAEASNVIMPGQPVDLAARGDFWVRTTTTATIGQKVFANNSDGTISTGAAGASVAGSTETVFTVASNANAGEAIKITPWSNV